VRRHAVEALAAPAREMPRERTSGADPRTDVRQRDVAYRTFWDHVGAEFPDLGGAASTTFYFENEQRLLRRHLGSLAGQRVLKTDLWDEARNTRILQWARHQGADVVGVDISIPVVRLAGAEFNGAPLTAVNADVRALPFSDASFDAVYSMGTIEHFPETDAAVREIYRVLKPGGRAIIGVPNRHDPFLRPLMVTILYSLGLYGYGFEKSYSRKTLRRMLEAAGFVVTGDDAILFIPGWLRMLDLLCHTRYPSVSRLTAAAVRLFGWIDAHLPAVRRHGYLVAAIGERPAAATRRG
jgi:SAM-dependent methyltransferase